jgi:hypothetical protein
MKFAFVPKDPNRKIGDQLEVHGQMMRVESFSQTGKNVVAVSLEGAQKFERIMCVSTENPPILGVTAKDGAPDKIVAMQMDEPSSSWRPGEIVQREGRITRGSSGIEATGQSQRAQADTAQEPGDYLPMGWKKEGYFYEFRSASGSKFTPTQIAKVVGGVVTKQGMYSIIGVPVHAWEAAKQKLKDSGMWTVQLERPKAQAQSTAPKAESLTAEQKIRQAFNQGPVQIGISKPVVVEHNGVTIQLMARLDRIHSQGQKESTIHMVRIKRGRMLSTMEPGWIQEAFKLTGKNELVESGLPKSINEEDARLFLANFARPQNEVAPCPHAEPTAFNGQSQQAQERMR